ncbi:MAG: hypothetical protein MJ209_00175 [archaeon]|nr:hypothetical protein [archaeon]
MRYNRGLKRRKAPFGTVEAATLAAAGIQAATTVATSAMEMKAAKENAKQAADIAVSNAEKEVAALRKQNENANDLQAKNQEFISAQNEENRDIQKTIQMNLQMMAAKQNEADRLATTRIQVRNGGSPLLRGTRKRAKALSGSQVVTSPYNLDFSVTDGGFVTPIGQSFTGDLYEIRGNDHDHYHKTKGGKRKTGVGIKFENGEAIEGEGNQNTNQGELLLVTPNDAKFISRHTLKGFNPARAVLQGMAPEQAFSIQENIKYNYNISDDGNMNKIRTKANSGYQVVNDLFTTNNMIIPDMSQDTTGAIAGSAMRSKLKCGGRRKAANGYKYLIDTENPDLMANQLTPDLGYNRLGAVSLNSKPSINDRNFRNPTSMSPDTDLTPDTSYSIPTADTDLSPLATLAEPKTKDRYGLTNTQAQLLGAGITGVGNAVGSILTIAGNRAASRIKNAGINSATDLALAGYDQLHGIDYSSINRDNYKATHEMPAIRLARYNIEPQLTGVSRSLERQRSTIANNTMSGAAAINRLNRAETNAYDMRSKLYGIKDNQEEAIKQKNIDTINKAVANNATRDMQSNLYRTRDLLDLAKYNNNIDNTKIALKTKAKTDRTLSIANNNALTRQTNMGVAANAFSSTAQGFANTLGEIGKQRAELDYTLLGSDMKTTMDLLDKYANSSDPVKRRYALRMRKQIGFTNRT